MSRKSSAGSRAVSGSLPKGWEIAFLGELGLGRTESIEPASEPDTLFELWSVPSFPSDKPERVLGSTIGSNKQRVAEGDVLLCKINPRINRVWRVGPASGLPQIASTEWIVFRSPTFDPAFLMWRFRENKFRAALCENMTGVGGSLTRARPKDVAQIEIALPPLPEQRRIVARLEALMARSGQARAKLREVPAQLAQARQSLLAAAFQSAGSSNSAEVRPLESLTQPDRSICYGVVQLGDETARGVPCIRTSDLKPLALLTDSPKRIHESVSSNYPRTILRGGEVLVSVRGTLGGIAVAPVSVRGWNISREVAMIALRELALPQFIAMAIAAPQSQAWLTSAIKGVAYSGINIADLKRLPIPLPALPEQGEIVRCLTAALAKLDAAATAHAAAVADLDRLDQALLAHAFTGQLVSPS